MRLLFAIALMMAIGCGRTGTSSLPDIVPVPAPAPAPDPEPSPLKKKVIVAVFGAPWCHFCHETLPRVQAQIEKLKVTEREAIDFRLYVISGATADRLADDKTTLAYQQSIGLNLAVAYSDVRGAMFRKYVGGGGIPAGAVISIDEKTVLRRYPGGNLDPIDIASFAAREASK
jgi:thiol-disulfide isomerase/thioredoxin